MKAQGGKGGWQFPWEKMAGASLCCESLRNYENVNKTTERDAINWGWETARNPSGSWLLSLHVPKSPAGGAGGTCQEGSVIPSYPASH